MYVKKMKHLYLFLNDILNLLIPLSSKKITNNDEKSIFSLLFAKKVRTLQRKKCELCSEKENSA